MDSSGRKGMYGPEFRGGTVEYAVVRFLHALSRAVRLHKLYPHDNAYVQQAVEDAYLAYDTLTGLVPGTSLIFLDGRVDVENTPLPAIPEQIQPLLQVLDTHGIGSMLLLPGGEVKEVASLACLLSLRPGAPPPGSVAHRSFDDIQTLLVTVTRPPDVQAVPLGAAGQAADAPGDREIVNLLLGEPEEVIGQPHSPLDPLLDGDARQLGTLMARVAVMGWSGPTDDLVHPAAIRVFESVLGRLITRRNATLTNLFERVIQMVAGLDREQVTKMAPGAVIATMEDLAAQLISVLRPDLKARAVLNSLEGDEPFDALAGAFRQASKSPAEGIQLLGSVASVLKERGTDFPSAGRALATALRLIKADTELSLQTSSAGKTKDFFTLTDEGPKPLVVVAQSAGYMSQSLAELLKQAGLDTIAFPDGQSALRGIEEKRPVLAVLDLNLPGIHGLDIIRQLKYKNLTPPLILTSDHPDMGNDFEVKTYPSCRFLTHPIAEKAFHEALQDLCAKHAIRTGARSPRRPVAGKVLKAKQYTAKLRAGEPLARGFDLAAYYLPQGGQNFELLDFFPVAGSWTGVFMAGREDYEDEHLVRARMLQAAVWMVGPWLRSAKDILLQAGALVGGDLFASESLDVCAVVLDPLTGTVSASSAGMPQGLLFHQGSPEVQALSKARQGMGGSPAGNMAKVLVQNTFALHPGSILLLTSRGVPYAASKAGVHFGWDSIKGIMLTATDFSPTEVITTVTREMERHMGGAPQDRDLVVVGIARQLQ